MVEKSLCFTAFRAIPATPRQLPSLDGLRITCTSTAGAGITDGHQGQELVEQRQLIGQRTSRCDPVRKR